MEKRRVQSKLRYVLAFLIATFLFVFGFSLSYTLSSLELNRIQNYQGGTSYSIFGDGVDYLYFNEEVCSSEYFEEISEDLGFQGKIIDDLERKLGKTNSKVLFQKQFYTLVELQHLSLVNIMKEKCELKVNTILFFYSNLNLDLKKSEDVGNVLNVVHAKNPKTYIYAFDINLNSEFVDKLKEKYNVTGSPTLIINEEIVVSKIGNIEDIEKYLY